MQTAEGGHQGEGVLVGLDEGLALGHVQLLEGEVAVGMMGLAVLDHVIRDVNTHHLSKVNFPSQRSH